MYGSSAQNPGATLTLLAHMIRADQQIHSAEIEALEAVYEKLGVDDATRARVEQVFTADDPGNPLVVASEVPQVQRATAFEMLVTMAHADAVCSPPERQLLDRVAASWAIKADDVSRLCASAEAAAHEQPGDKPVADSSSLGSKLLRVAERLVPARVIDRLVASSDGARAAVGRWRRESLLAGPEYDRAIERCADIARDDFDWARASLEKTQDCLSKIGPALAGGLDTIAQRARTGTGTMAKGLGRQLAETKVALDEETEKRLVGVTRALCAKQRALRCFTVAFMGKTKAGKSTLHAVVTDGGWDGIGVGAQRTTRLNRVYEWRRVRIIDTPGIGAPHGQSDEEIAASVTDEADVICFVVTNDSQQETEFRFLRALKASAKPLIILLNVKENLRDPERLKRFLRNPDRAFRLDGPSGLEGHIARIRRYATEHYGNDLFEIVPVQLLAAQMSREQAHRADAEALYRASRLQDFLDGIRASLVIQGIVRRSQNLLGGTIGEIRRTEAWLQSHAREYQQTAEEIGRKQKAIAVQLERAERDATAVLDRGVAEAFARVRSAVDRFAEEHWDRNEKELRAAWQHVVEATRLEAGMQNALELAGGNFARDARDALDEIGRELLLTANLKAGAVRLDAQDRTTHLKTAMRWGGHALIIAGGVAAFITPLAPFAAALALTGVAINLLSKLFESRETKRGRAVARIATTLREQLDEQQQQCRANALAELQKQMSGTASAVGDYFKTLADALETTGETFACAETQVAAIASHLDTGYGMRLVDWASDVTAPLETQRVAASIADVKHEFGQRIAVRARRTVVLARPLIDIRRIVQHDVEITPTA